MMSNALSSEEYFTNSEGGKKLRLERSSQIEDDLIALIN